MDNIEITVFDEIKDYKEKIYFLNLRQWIFAILIVLVVVPIYMILKDKIGEELTSYIVIILAGILGFIGFVKIHELAAEKIIPYWIRHYILFSKPIYYISDEEYMLQHQKKKKCRNEKNNKTNENKGNVKKEIKNKSKGNIFKITRKKHRKKSKDFGDSENIKEV